MSNILKKIAGRPVGEGKGLDDVLLIPSAAEEPAPHTAEPLPEPERIPDATPLEPAPALSYVAQQFLERAKLFRDRQALYGNNYHRHGKIMELLLNGQHIDTLDQHALARLGIFTQMVSKMTRYGENFFRDRTVPGVGASMDDSLDDLSVYTTMLKELDHAFQRQ